MTEPAEETSPRGEVLVDHSDEAALTVEQLKLLWHGTPQGIWVSRARKLFFIPVIAAGVYLQATFWWNLELSKCSACRRDRVSNPRRIGSLCVGAIQDSYRRAADRKPSGGSAVRVGTTSNSINRHWSASRIDVLTGSSQRVRQFVKTINPTVPPVCRSARLVPGRRRGGWTGFHLGRSLTDLIRSIPEPRRLAGGNRPTWRKPSARPTAKSLGEPSDDSAARGQRRYPRQPVAASWLARSGSASRSSLTSCTVSPPARPVTGSEARRLRGDLRAEAAG
jgi:hypothetical protein